MRFFYLFCPLSLSPGFLTFVFVNTLSCAETHSVPSEHKSMFQTQLTESETERETMLPCVHEVQRFFSSIERQQIYIYIYIYMTTSVRRTTAANPFLTRKLTIQLSFDQAATLARHYPMSLLPLNISLRESCHDTSLLEISARFTVPLWLGVSWVPVPPLRHRP